MWEQGKAWSCWFLSPIDSPHMPQQSSSSSTHCRNFTTCSLSSCCCSLLRQMPSDRQCTFREHSCGKTHGTKYGYSFKPRLSLLESKETFFCALCTLWKQMGNKFNLDMEYVDIRMVIVLSVVCDVCYKLLNAQGCDQTPRKIPIYVNIYDE